MKGIFQCPKCKFTVSVLDMKVSHPESLCLRCFDVQYSEFNYILPLTNDEKQIIIDCEGEKYGT